jgi:hypothetical protein
MKILKVYNSAGECRTCLPSQIAMMEANGWTRDAVKAAPKSKPKAKAKSKKAVKPKIDPGA